MKRITHLVLILAVTFSALGQGQKKPPQEEPEDVLRITTALVQTDVVVVDKNEHPISDLKREDFELYENGKKQDVKFMEFVSTEEGRRSEGERPASLPVGAEVPRDLSAKELKRVVAFVVDDLTIPFEDMSTVREMLLDFVNNKMKDGDLVAIIRTVGGKGLLQQFTSDRQLLRRAIAALNITLTPYNAYNNTTPDRFASNPAATGTEGVGNADVSAEEQGIVNLNDPNEETQRLFRGLMSLSTADYVIDSLKEIPGRKSLLLISRGIPIFEVSSTGTIYSNVSHLLSLLADHAMRAGVAISTMDPRGLKASSGVASFTSTPGRSALGGEDPTFGRGGGSDQMFGPTLAGASEHLGLGTVADATGGVSIVNTNNFKNGLDKVLARSNAYYLLAYTPVDKFDNKVRKIEVKVKRDGARVYSHRGYIAREETSNANRTKQEEIVAAAKSPIAKRDVEVSANLNLKFGTGKAGNQLDIHLAIGADKLTFTKSPDGKYQTSFDVVGFIYDHLGRVRGGFSETINTDLTPEKYQEALKTGLTYSANTDLPPGYYQVRAVVREDSTGYIGTVSRYVEIPDITNGRLAMSSVFLFAVDLSAKTAPTPLLAVRQVSSKEDLRYAALVYNPKTANGQAQVTSQTIISQGSKVLYREPEQPVPYTGSSPVTKIGQVAVAGVTPGRYTLTIVVTDQLADKKIRTLARSVDFAVVK